jgi:DNA-binding MarR family transcriptional regulator
MKNETIGKTMKRFLDNYKQTRDYTKKCRRAKLTLLEAVVLACLAENTASTIIDMAECIYGRVNASGVITVGRYVDRLLRQQLVVTSNTGSDDKRKLQVRLTRKGQLAVKALTS